MKTNIYVTEVKHTGKTQWVLLPEGSVIPIKVHGVYLFPGKGAAKSALLSLGCPHCGTKYNRDSICPRCCYHFPF